jgi:membrane-bound ClpP family serine protease
VHGENWLAQSPVNVPRGGKVRVLAIRNLRLRVEPVEVSDEKEN